MSEDIRKKILEISNTRKERSNQELISAMENLKKDFEQTKGAIIQLTKHLDGVELVYNKILEEYENRINGK